MENIKDLSKYNEEMQKSMREKMWWLDMTDAEVVVDYGCADGTLLQLIHQERPDLTLIGVDNNPDMLELAKRKLPNALFLTTAEFFATNDNYQNAVLVLSSVIHEIYSYEANPAHVMDLLFGKYFRYIAIRDMFLGKELETIAAIEDAQMVLANTNPIQLNEFEYIWGSISTRSNLLHYLLKYRYLVNWEREVRENYFPINLEYFIECIIPTEYHVEYFEHYIPEFLQKQMKNDFGVCVTDKTHLKLLLQLD